MYWHRIALLRRDEAAHATVTVVILGDNKGDSKMLRFLIICVVVGLLVLGTAGTASALYPNAVIAEETVTVGGSWTSVNWYESDGSWSGVGDPAVSDWDSQAQGASPINLSTTASDAYGSASSNIQVDSGPPMMTIHSDADLASGAGPHWAMSYSMGGANWLTSGATQTVDVYVDYTLGLALVEPGVAYANLYVAFWGPNGDLLLDGDDEWVVTNSGGADFLMKTVTLNGAGNVTDNSVPDWQVPVTDGAYYSFWGMTEAYVELPVPEPATMALVGFGLLGLLLRKRR